MQITYCYITKAIVEVLSEHVLIRNHRFRRRFRGRFLTVLTVLTPFGRSPLLGPTLSKFYLLELRTIVNRGFPTRQLIVFLHN